MKLKERGKYFELPIIGLNIKKIIFDGLLRIVFNDIEESFLDFHSEFKVIRFNQEQVFNANSKEAYELMFDLFGQVLREAKADKFGNLFLEVEDSTKLIVEDGPFENWHYTKINNQNKKDNLFVHGGVGTTSF